MGEFENFITETFKINKIGENTQISDIQYLGDYRLEKNLAIISYDPIYVDCNIYFIENEILDGYNIKEIFLFCINEAIPSHINFSIQKIKNEKLRLSIFSEINKLVEENRLVQEGNNLFSKREINIYKQIKKMIDTGVYNRDLIEKFNKLEENNFSYYIEVYKKFFNNKRWKDIEDKILFIINYYSNDLYLSHFVENNINSIDFISYYLNQFKDNLLNNKFINFIKKIIIHYKEKAEITIKSDIWYLGKKLDVIFDIFYSFIVNNKELMYQVSNLLEVIKDKSEGINYYNFKYEKSKKLVKMFS